MQEKVFKDKYLNIYKIQLEKRKTPIFQIKDKTDEIILGEIKWYSSWRKFCFYPATDTIWDGLCLYSLTSFLNECNYKWQNNIEK